MRRTGCFLLSVLPVLALSVLALSGCTQPAAAEPSIPAESPSPAEASSPVEASKPAEALDVSELAKSLADGVRFSSELRELSAEALSGYLDLPENAEAAAYMSTGTTAEEIFVVRCATAEDAQTVEYAIQDFLDGQRMEMERYQPQEAARIDGAVLIRSGTIVVLCVTDDAETAEKLIENAMK